METKIKLLPHALPRVCLTHDLAANPKVSQKQTQLLQITDPRPCLIFTRNISVRYSSRCAYILITQQKIRNSFNYTPIDIFSWCKFFALIIMKKINQNRLISTYLARDILRSLMNFCKMIFQPKGHTNGQLSRGFKSSRTSSLRIPSSWSQRMMVSEVAVSPNFSFRQFSKLGFNAVAGVIAL